MGKADSIAWKRKDYFFEAKLRVPVLGGIVRVEVDLEDDSCASPSTAQLKSLTCFANLATELKSDWTHQIALDCHYTCLQLEVEGEKPPLRLRRRSNVWKHLKLTDVFVPQHGKSVDRYVFVAGSCDWEDEHGLELLFKNEQLLKVGRSDGLAQNEEWELYYINE